MYFSNRTDAGRRLSEALQKYKNKDAIIYALPRGGVETAVQIAMDLNFPLDLVIARKVGHPFSPEYAIAAVTENGQTVSNPEEVRTIDPIWFNSRTEEAMKEAKRRRAVYMAGRKSFAPSGKIAILVDDGIATGLTVESAILDLKKGTPRVWCSLFPLRRSRRLNDFPGLSMMPLYCLRPNPSLEQSACITNISHNFQTTMS